MFLREMKKRGSRLKLLQFDKISREIDKDNNSLAQQIHEARLSINDSNDCTVHSRVTNVLSKHSVKAFLML